MKKFKQGTRAFCQAIFILQAASKVVVLLRDKGIGLLDLCINWNDWPVHWLICAGSHGPEIGQVNSSKLWSMRPSTDEMLLRELTTCFILESGEALPLNWSNTQCMAEPPRVETALVASSNLVCLLIVPLQIPDTATGCSGLMFTSMLTGWMLTGPSAKRRATADLRKGLPAQGLPHFAAWG